MANTSTQTDYYRANRADMLPAICAGRTPPRIRLRCGTCAGLVRKLRRETDEPRPDKRTNSMRAKPPDFKPRPQTQAARDARLTFQASYTQRSGAWRGFHVYPPAPRSGPHNKKRGVS
jgi:hypothetical protein